MQFKVKWKDLIWIPSTSMKTLEQHSKQSRSQSMPLAGGIPGIYLKWSHIYIGKLCIITIVGFHLKIIVNYPHTSPLIVTDLTWLPLLVKTNVCHTGQMLLRREKWHNIQGAKWTLFDVFYKLISIVFFVHWVKQIYQPLECSPSMVLVIIMSPITRLHRHINVNRFVNYVNYLLLAAKCDNSCVGSSGSSSCMHDWDLYWDQ